MSFYQKMRDFMFENRFPYTGELNNYGNKYKAFSSENNECKKGCCRYRVFESELGAHITCWKRSLDIFWFVKNPKTLSFHEKLLLQEERDNIKNYRIEMHNKASKKCINFLSKIIKFSNNSSHHPYVVKKKIFPFMCFTFRKLLVIPIMDIDFNIKSLQFIYKNGFKKFKTNAPTQGNMIFLTKELDSNYSGVIRICEGWSTGCTLRSITKEPVICALNCYNLLKVAISVRKKYVHALIKIIADNDSYREENVGIKNAKIAALQVGAPLNYPIFDELNVASKPTDFNDLFILFGQKEVEKQLNIPRR